MKKQFYSFLGLLLLLSAWGGAHSAVLAQVQLQKVQTVDVATAEDHYIPAGWTVNYQGTDRTAGQSYSSERGPRVFTFSQSAVVNKALYMNTDTTDPTYAVYGNQENYLLSIPAGYVEIRVPAFLWGKDSGKAQVEVLQYESGKDVSALEVVARRPRV
jgi:hypothetical protein